MIDAHMHLELLDSDVPEDITLLSIYNNLNKLHTLNKKTYTGVGVHPNDVDKYDDMTIYENFFAEADVIGETGIDLYRSNNLHKQIEYLEKHIMLCKKYNKNIVIHLRNCEPEEVLNRLKGTGIMAQFHCFNSSVINAKKIIDQGHLLSFSGLITFVPELAEAVKFCPLSNILCETDSPLLAPVPYRGKKNHPKFVKIVYETVCQIKDIEMSVLIEEIRKNFAKLIGH